MVMLTIVLLAAALLGGSAQENGRTDCRDALAFQVLLDRQGFSSGEIDGRIGANTSRALAAFQEARGLPPSGAPDCATLEALGRDTAVVIDYTISENDAGGPFAATI